MEGSAKYQSTYYLFEMQNVYLRVIQSYLTAVCLLSRDMYIFVKMSIFTYKFNLLDMNFCIYEKINKINWNNRSKKKA